MPPKPCTRFHRLPDRRIHWNHTYWMNLLGTTRTFWVTLLLAQPSGFSYFFLFESWHFTTFTPMARGEEKKQGSATVSAKREGRVSSAVASVEGALDPRRSGSFPFLEASDSINHAPATRRQSFKCTDGSPTDSKCNQPTAIQETNAVGYQCISHGLTHAGCERL